MRVRELARGSLRRPRGIEHAEARRTRSRHARKPATRERTQCGRDVGDDRLDQDRGRLEIIAVRRKQRQQGVPRRWRELGKRRARASLARRDAKPLENALGGNGNAGMHQHRRKRRQRQRVGEELPDSTHHARTRIKTNRNVRAGRARRIVNSRIAER